MNNDNIIAFQPSERATPFRDALSKLVRQGARQIIAQAVEVELQKFLSQYQSLKDDRRLFGMDTCRSERLRQALGTWRFRCRRCVTAVATVSSSTHHYCHRISNVPRVLRRYCLGCILKESQQGIL